MKHFTTKTIWQLIAGGESLTADRRPAPMPGKKYPTRVAWKLEVQLKKVTRKKPVKIETSVVACSEYIGKPNRYRALEVQKLLQKFQRTGGVSGWVAEFDKDGLIAYRLFPLGGNPVGAHSGAFFAYHPHSAEADIVSAFARQVHVKYIGGMRLYSEKKKLTAEAVDAYYQWYYKQFKKKLRRPKAVASAIIGGEKVEPDTE